MINKQKLWFLTLFSLILVLSVYYITMPNDLLVKSSNSEVTTKKTTKSEVSLHSKFKKLLRTPFYTEFVLQKASMDELLGDIKEEASDFIQSFYFEKIKVGE